MRSSASRSPPKSAVPRPPPSGWTTATIAVGEKHQLTIPERGPFWGDSFNLYSKGAVYPYADLAPTMVLQLEADYKFCSDTLKVTVNSDNYCKYGWSSTHSGGQIQFGFADGSVKGIPKSIDLKILAALATIAGGEVVGNY